MKRIAIERIVVRNRQRRKIETGALKELTESILARGLMHPPVVTFDPAANGYLLVAGERRFRAIQSIARDELVFFCDGAAIMPGEVPVIELCDLTPADLAEAELDENVIRVDLPWQDKVDAIDAIHAMRTAENPEHTINETAQEFSDKTQDRRKFKSVRQDVSRALALSQAMVKNPVIAKARTENEAHQLLLKQEEERLRAELMARSARSTNGSERIDLQHGDLHELFASLSDSSVDLILTDPPYGIAANAGGFRDRTVHHHEYDDSFDNARSIVDRILVEGFRVTRPNANLFLFTDIDHFYWLRDRSRELGWTPFRTPLLWRKSESEGLAPWGSAGPRRTYDMIFYATKGERGLVSSPVDILDEKRVGRAERTHAAEKPLGLMRHLIECATLVDDTVLDPCCGSGSTLLAAFELRRRSIGFEKDEHFINTARARIGDLLTPKQTDLEDLLA